MIKLDLDPVDKQLIHTFIDNNINSNYKPFAKDFYDVEEKKIADFLVYRIKFITSREGYYKGKTKFTGSTYTIPPALIPVITNIALKHFKINLTFSLSDYCAEDLIVSEIYNEYSRRFLGVNWAPNNPFIYRSSTGSKKRKIETESEKLQNMWQKCLDEKGTDFTFVVEEKEIKAHKTILAMNSDVLDTCLNNPMVEKQESKMVVNECKFETFKFFLEFLYTGKVSISVNDIQNWILLLPLGDRYNVQSLKNLCENVILEHIEKKAEPQVGLETLNYLGFVLGIEECKSFLFTDVESSATKDAELKEEFVKIVNLKNIAAFIEYAESNNLTKTLILLLKHQVELLKQNA